MLYGILRDNVIESSSVITMLEQELKKAGMFKACFCVNSVSKAVLADDCPVLVITGALTGPTDRACRALLKELTLEIMKTFPEVVKIRNHALFKGDING